MTNSMTHGELFAGISGFGLGFGRARIKTIWHVEIDRNCQGILRRHYPDSLILSDVRECGVHNLPHVDIISFGSPCQDMSVAGKREGIKGERSGLFFEAIRIIKELRPTFAIWENVPGSFSSNGGRDFGAVLDALAESGAMDIAWRVLDAQWFGLAQRRKRVFVVADFGGERAAEILSVPEGVCGDYPPSRETGKGIAAPIEAGTPSRRNGGSAPVADSFIINAFNGYTGGPDDNDAQANHLVAFGGNNTSGPIDISTAQNAHGGTGRFDFESETFLTAICLKERAGSGKGGKGFLGRKDIAFGVGGYQQRVGVRRLTPVECERLQGFPDGWTDGYGQSDSVRYRQLGNAVAVPVAEWIARRIVAIGEARGRA